MVAKKRPTVDRGHPNSTSLGQRPAAATNGRDGIVKHRRAMNA